MHQSYLGKSVTIMIKHFIIIMSLIVNYFKLIKV